MKKKEIFERGSPKKIPAERILKFFRGSLRPKKKKLKCLNVLLVNSRREGASLSPGPTTREHEVSDDIKPRLPPPGMIHSP